MDFRTNVSCRYQVFDSRKKYIYEVKITREN